MAPATVDHDVVVFILGAEGAGRGAQAAVTLLAVRLLAPTPATGSCLEAQVPHSNPPLLVCRPPCSRSPVFSHRLPLLGLQRCCFATAAGVSLLCPLSLPLPRLLTPAPQPHPLSKVVSLLPGCPNTSSSLLAKVFRAAASVGTTAAQGQLPTA